MFYGMLECAIYRSAEPRCLTAQEAIVGQRKTLKTVYKQEALPNARDCIYAQECECMRALEILT